MMYRIRKNINLLLLATVLFFSSITSSRALNVDLKKLGKIIDSFNSTTQSVYIIGSYAFTTNHTLTTQDMMLTARSIIIEDIVENNNAYNEMTVFKLDREYVNYEPTGNWKISSNFIGNTSYPETGVYNIEYVDYKKVENKYDVTVEDGVKTYIVKVDAGSTLSEPEVPERSDYEFLGWYKDGVEYKFDEPVNDDFTLEAHWKGYADIYLEAVAKNKTVNSASYVSHTERVYEDGKSIAADIVASYSHISDVLHSVLSEEDVEEDTTLSTNVEIYQTEEDGKLHTYTGVGEDESSEKEWFHCDSVTDKFISSVDEILNLNFKKVEKVESDVANQTKLRLIVDKSVIEDQDDGIEYDKDLDVYAYINEDGYIVKLVTDYHSAMSDTWASAFSKYEETISFEQINNQNNLSIPDEIKNKAVDLCI